MFLMTEVSDIFAAFMTADDEFGREPSRSFTIKFHSFRDSCLTPKACAVNSNAMLSGSVISTLSKRCCTIFHESFPDARDVTG